MSVIETQYPINFREKEAKELGGHLRRRQSVNIVGLKRVGISNLLRFFMYHKDIIKTYIGDNREHLFIPIDLNDLIELEIYPFWVLTLKRIVDASEKSQMPQETKNKIGSLFLNSIQSQDLFLLIDSVRQALLLIVNEGLLPTLFFNRFDRISAVFTPSFFNNLQGLRDATHQELAYVFTSFRSLNSIFPAARASLSVFAQILYIQPAIKKDMIIIYNTYKQRYSLNLSQTIEQELFNMINGNIQYLQLALIILSEKKNSELKSKEELFKVLIRDERITLQSEELWESLGRDEKKTLIKIVRQEKITQEDREKNSYLWDTGFVKNEAGASLLFSPLFASYLESIEKEEVKNNTIMYLTRKEHLLFTLLESRIDNICEREEVIEAVWPESKEFGVSDWAIDRLVARVRVKLKKQNSSYEIITVRTRGYKLCAIKE